MSAEWDNWIAATSALKPGELAKGMGFIVQSRDPRDTTVGANELVKELPAVHKKEIAIASLKQLDGPTVRDVVKTLALPTPTASANDKLWTIFIYVLSSLFVITGASLVLGMFIPMDNKKYFVSPEAIFTLWSTVTAYLVGLFSPAPKKDTSANGSTLL